MLVFFFLGGHDFVATYLLLFFFRGSALPKNIKITKNNCCNSLYTGVLSNCCLHCVGSLTGDVIMNKLATELKSVNANWNKATGPKPTMAELNAAVALGQKPGTKKWAACAMYCRKLGSTRNEIVAAMEKPQANVWRDMKPSLATKEQHKRNGHFAYTLRVIGKPAK
jgi:hypothetical protein